MRLQLGESEKVEMILCVVFGCGTRTDQDKGIGFYRIPSVVKSQSSFEEELKTERRENWIPFFQEDGCLAVNTAKAHGEEDYICRATNSFGLTETVTTVIATKLIGIITVIAFITFQLYIQNTFLPYVFFIFFFLLQTRQENVWQKS